MAEETVSNELVKILACPHCKGNVKKESKSIVCEECGREYPIVDGIPHMLPDELR